MIEPLIHLMINHWRALPRPIIGLGICLVTVCLLIGFASHYQRNQGALLNDARAAYDHAQEKLQLSKQEQQDIEQYLPHYQRLLQTGFIGEEQRHLWIARLHHVGVQHQLFTIDYKIGPQTAYDSKLILNLRNYKMQRSVMTLRWDLLHEEDFIHLVTDLREGTSPFMVRDCEIAQASDIEMNGQRVQKNLTANCAIDWLTIQDSQLKPAVKVDF